LDAVIKVLWDDGRVTQHQLVGLPGLPTEQLVEMLEHDLASYLPPDEMPISEETGDALAWASVIRVVRVDSIDADPSNADWTKHDNQEEK
jgi:hypothetical protein